MIFAYAHNEVEYSCKNSTAAELESERMRDLVNLMAVLAVMANSVDGPTGVVPANLCHLQSEEDLGDIELEDESHDQLQDDGSGVVVKIK